MIWTLIPGAMASYAMGYYAALYIGGMIHKYRDRAELRRMAEIYGKREGVENE